MQRLFSVLIGLLSSLNPLIVAAITAATAAVSAVNFANDLWQQLFAHLDALVKPSVAGTVDFSPFTLCNYFFPLDTLCTLTTTFAALYVSASAIRIIKSFIPTIA